MEAERQQQEQLPPVIGSARSPLSFSSDGGGYCRTFSMVCLLSRLSGWVGADREPQQLPGVPASAAPDLGQSAGTAGDAEVCPTMAAASPPPPHVMSWKSDPDATSPSINTLINQEAIYPSVLILEG